MASKKTRVTKQTPAHLLREWQRLQATFGIEAAARRRQMLAQLRNLRMSTAKDVVALHEALLFSCAYPDDAEMRATLDEVLAEFGRRRDVRQFADELWDSGLSGTDIWFSFYWPTARWLVQRWPQSLVIDWAEFENQERLGNLLSLLVPYTETPGLDEFDFSMQEWIDELKGPDETDAQFLVQRIDAMASDQLNKEALYDELNVPLQLLADDGTPSRTLARMRDADVHYQQGELNRKRPDLLQAVRVPPRTVHRLSGRAAQELVDLARISMVTRSRDLDVFCHGDKNDVRLVDCGDGLCFALIGVKPERRLMFESAYGMLTLKNGVPMGYVLISGLFESACVAYNVFDTFRGGEAAHVLGRALSVAHHVFGADTFSIDPYQLGHNNAEGFESGAWWFYQKLGFRPFDERVRKLMRRELSRMKKDRSYRSDLDTMRELVVDDMHLQLGDPREQILGRMSLGSIGLAVTNYVAKRFGSDRERAVRVCSEEARALLGTGPDVRWSKGEKLWWSRWAPVVLCLPGVRRWSAKDKRALVAIVRAKGASCESDFVRLFDAHGKLRESLLALADSDE